MAGSFETASPPGFQANPQQQHSPITHRDMMHKKCDNIDEYIAGFPEHIQEKLEAMRRHIRAAAPQAEETISYHMPAFRQKKVLVYFAAFKHHIGFYPTSSGVTYFSEELSAYDCSKGAVRFAFDQEIPWDLIHKIVRFRVETETGSAR
jgi:uncharacterized protein YdhG (YjbR/CyaY superfamily)